STGLEESEVRAIVRLLAGVCAHPGGHAEKKRMLMNGLCALVHADAWAWVLAAELIPGELPTYCGYQYDGFTEKEFARFLKVQTYPDMAALTAPFIRDLHSSAPG